jgi:hypothetical protein
MVKFWLLSTGTSFTEALSSDADRAKTAEAEGVVEELDDGSDAGTWAAEADGFCGAGRAIAPVTA